MDGFDNRVFLADVRLLLPDVPLSDTFLTLFSETPMKPGGIPTSLLGVKRRIITRRGV